MDDRNRTGLAYFMLAYVPGRPLDISSIHENGELIDIMGGLRQQEPTPTSYAAEQYPQQTTYPTHI